jgi:hypothetical protein
MGYSGKIHNSALIMHFLIAFLLLFCVGEPARVELIPPLTAESRTVKQAFSALNVKPSSKQAQLAYLRAFPNTKAAFLRVFMDVPNFGQLYNESHEYIAALQRISKAYPQEVLRKCFAVGKDLTWDADAVGYLQHATVEIGVASPRTFAEEARKLTAPEQLKLFRFLADVESHRDYIHYPLLMKRLTETGASDLAAKLRRAKERRIKEPHG